MKNIFLFLSLIFATKLVEDNLPNLHYKKLFDFFAPVILLAYIGLLSIIVKITNNPQLKKTLLTLMALIAVTILLTNTIEQNKQQKPQ